MPAIDIDRDPAREAAQHELAKPIYPKSSLLERFSDWLDDLVYRIAQEGSSLPGGWLTISVLLIVVVVAIVVAVRVARRMMRTNRGLEPPLFGSSDQTAAQYRATAERYAAQGDWAAAIRHRLRAVARQLEEDGALNPVPGRTATELARDAGSAVPNLVDEMTRAAVIFNDVTYGERPGTEDGYRMIAELDDHLRTRTATRAEAQATSAASGDWTAVG